MVTKKEFLSSQPNLNWRGVAHQRAAEPTSKPVRNVATEGNQSTSSDMEGGDVPDITEETRSKQTKSKHELELALQPSNRISKHMHDVRNGVFGDMTSDSNLAGGGHQLRRAGNKSHSKAAPINISSPIDKESTQLGPDNSMLSNNSTDIVEKDHQVVDKSPNKVNATSNKADSRLLVGQEQAQTAEEKQYSDKTEEKADNSNSNTSSVQVEEDSSDNLDPASFDRAFLLLLTAFVTAMIFFVKQLKTCRKPRKSKEFKKTSKIPHADLIKKFG